MSTISSHTSLRMILEIFCFHLPLSLVEVHFKFYPNTNDRVYSHLLFQTQTLFKIKGLGFWFKMLSEGMSYKWRNRGKETRGNEILADFWNTERRLGIEHHASLSNLRSEQSLWLKEEGPAHSTEVELAKLFPAGYGLSAPLLPIGCGLNN